ncbi:MAG TPA: nucleotidyltransferase family protein [Herpetosiphonaceae bacterium]
MKAMVLAAGAGTRLQPLTDSIPKPLLPIRGEPLLAHTLRWLKRYDITDVALNLHYLPEVIQDQLGDGSQLGMNLIYSFEPELLGTAGAVKKLAALFDEPFVVVYGDLLLDVNLRALLDYHQSRRALVTIGLKHTDDPPSQGMIACDSSGRVVRFVEKPAEWSDAQMTSNAGVYIVEPEALQHVPADRPSDWGHDLFPLLLAAGLPIYAQLLDGAVIDIGTLAAYEQVKDTGLPGRERLAD